MKWLENLISYQKNGDPGKCPVCGKKNIKVTELHYGRESICFQCKSCGETAHFDGKIK